jgi:hypothetical protein
MPFGFTKSPEEKIVRDEDRIKQRMLFQSGIFTTSWDLDTLSHT